MASQSPDDEEGTDGSVGKYKDAWSAIRALTMEQGASWSGSELNCSYFNNGDGRFVNISALSGAEFIDDARTVVPVDWDNDGDLDLILKNRTAPRLRVLRNDYPGSAHFLAVDLRASVGHPDAIGAQVVVKAGGKPFTKRIYCGDGFLAQRSRRLHFGLGQAANIESLTVHWTDGSSETLTDIPLDSFIRITQGTGSFETLKVRSGRLFRQAPADDVDTRKRPVTRVPLVTKLPLGPMPLPSFADPERRVKNLAGAPILINLWASWCAGCKVELADFEKHADEIAASGLQIVPLTTDLPEDYPAAAKILAAHGLGQHSGPVTPSLMNAFELLMIEVFGKAEEMPLPTSFLLDQAGQLVAVYMGPVDPATLMKDVRRLSRMNPRNAMDTQFFGGGRWILPARRNHALLARGFQLIGFKGLARTMNQLASGGR